MKFIKDCKWSFLGAILTIVISNIVVALMSGTTVPSESTYMIYIVLYVFTLPAAITFALLNGFRVSKVEVQNRYLYSGATCIFAVILYALFIGSYSFILIPLTVIVSLFGTNRGIASQNA
jgi:hypothetical protein